MRAGQVGEIGGGVECACLPGESCGVTKAGLQFRGHGSGEDGGHVAVVKA